MMVNQDKRAVGVFPRMEEAAIALSELKSAHFPMDKISVIAKNAYQNQNNMAGATVTREVGNQANEGATAGALTGGTLGIITGLLVGLGVLAIPGIGPIMLAGAEATALASTLAGGAIGAAAGSLVGALVGLGIPEEKAQVYSDRVSRGEYLLVVNGSDREIERAHQILTEHGIEEWGIYDVPTGTPSHISTYPMTR